jgi:uncharacterized protein YjdB
MSRANFLPAVFVGLAIGAAACTLRAPAAPPDGGTAALRVSAQVSGTPIATLVVRVTAPDIPNALVFNLERVGDVAAGILRVPPGDGREFAAEAYDSRGDLTHEGSTIADVRLGVNPPLTLRLLARAGQVPVSVVVASHAVVVTPAVAEPALGETLTLSAQVVATDGTVLPGTVAWASTNPARAAVARNAAGQGVVTTLDTGAVQIVAAYEGAAGVSALTIVPGLTTLAR